MRIATISAVILLSATAADAKSLEDRARDAVSKNERTAEAAIAVLRSAGPAGLDAFLAVHADAIGEATPRRVRLDALASKGDPRVLGALDRVCAQKDCIGSRLFWYTDLEQAKAASRASGKPILSLHLLGRLDEEYSCANSRFFRATLYPNDEVRKILRERFVLHWHSVRPAPKITIDFGDGRTLTRTITGNSIHYVLDSDGNPVDAIPGLYGPGLFRGALLESEEAFRAAKGKTGAARTAALKRYHDAKVKQALAAWARDVKKATGKPVPATLPALEKATTDELWYSIGYEHAGDATLDDATRAHLAARFSKEFPDAEEAGARAMSKAVYENPMLRKIRSFERTLGADMMQNEYRFRAIIRERIGSEGEALAPLNDWVYRAVFLTPPEDPWLGLKDGFGGLDEG